jgi:hypothetical protein
MVPPANLIQVDTQEGGRFRLWVAAGHAILVASADGYAPASADAVAPSKDVVLTLTPGSIISGQVVSAADAAPVGAVEVRAVPEGSWASPVHPSAASDTGGLFAIRGLRPGRYKLVAEDAGQRGESRGLVTSRHSRPPPARWAERCASPSPHA